MPSTPAATTVASATTDAELVALAAQGDAPAFETIMRRHNRLLFRTARSILQGDAEAEDALQDAYLRAWRALPGFRADARLSTWLVRIVINEALARLRGRRAQVIALDTVSGDADAALDAWLEDDPAARPERMAMRAQMRALIEARIDLLPQAFRTVFVLRAVEEMSVDEVAAALGIPEATVRTRYFRARSLLREGLLHAADISVDEAFSFDGQRCDRIVAAVRARL